MRGGIARPGRHDEDLRRSGGDCRRSTVGHQGLAGSWRDAVEHGRFAAPYSRDSAMSFVDYRDVAEVAALALAGDDLVDGAFELAAGGMLTRTEIAAMISRHAGRTVLAEDVDPDVALGGMPAGAMRDGLTAMFADYTA